jgi:hypothetical protein
MNPNSIIRHRRDLFVASRNPFASRWSTLLLTVPSTEVPRAAAPGGNGEVPEEDEDLDEDDDEDDDFDDEDDADDDETGDDEGAEATAEPDGQFPNAPDALKDLERPGAPQNRHGDRGGVS